MVYNILILGCGNLGKRYFEGILKSKLDLNIYLVEIDNKVRLDINKNLFELRTKHKIHLHKTINDLKQKRFNILINTTTASGRFELIEKCVFKFKGHWHSISSSIFFSFSPSPSFFPLLFDLS